jgi:hypothetical protein
MERGRTEISGRASPEYYSHHGDIIRSQSPAGSFYHENSPVRPVTPTIGAFIPSFPTAFSTAKNHSLLLEGHAYVDYPEVAHKEQFTAQELRNGTHYKYTSLASNEIRLLRISPGSGGPLFCALKAVPLAKLISGVLEFQALSYAWGNDPPDQIVYLSDLPRSGDGLWTVNTEDRPYLIRRNLYQALERIRRTSRDSWIWCDALCIEQTNQSEKSQQIQKMPDIYSNAWNVIAWLGEDESVEGDVDGSVGLIPVILNLKLLDVVLQDQTPSEEILKSWVSFGRLLQRPWFKRRWVIQEVACARRLSVRIADRILSWLDFADAVDLYLGNIDRMRTLYRQSKLSRTNPTALDGIESSKAVALMNFSRNVFRRSSDSTIVSRLMGLENLVLKASSFAVSDIRDTIYALLYLANDTRGAHTDAVTFQTQCTLTSDYAKHAADVLLGFARYCMATSKSLDIICRPWASWPSPRRHDLYKGRLLPTWIGVASFGEDGSEQRLVPEEGLLGPIGSPMYDACRGIAMPAQALSPRLKHVLHAEGIILGTIDWISTSIDGQTLESRCLQMLGWDGKLEEGIDDSLWQTLVANRNPDGKTAPTWYRRACALALTKLDVDGNLQMAESIADKSQPGTVIDYLKRVQTATLDRRIFRCASAQMAVGTDRALKEVKEPMIGMGPQHMGLYDHYWVCILFGCSVPVILTRTDLQRDDTSHAILVGACYVHGYMEGETFAGMSEEEIQSKSITFSIH